MPRLTDEIKQAMRELRASGLGLREIAKATGFSTGTVSTAVKGVPIPVARYSKTMPVGLFEGSIVDIETTGREPETSELVTYGCLVNNQMRVLQRVEASEREFCQSVHDEIALLTTPIYAYNAGFDAGYLSSKLGDDIKLMDIMDPWKARAEKEGLKWPSLDDLAAVPREYFGERQMQARAVPLIWSRYLESADMRLLSQIVRHVMEDLRQALYVLTFMDIEG
jgi:hypothetical protein